jgi:kindlin 2
MMMMMTSAKQTTTTTTPMLFHTISGQQQQWELRVDIVDLEEPLQSQQQQRLRVSGETHIGGVICQLAEKMASTHASMSRQDWSDYALWWPDKSMWLSKTKQTLDQYGVQADALLHFTRMHKPLRVQLPDLQLVHLPSVDFSLPLFYVVKAVCKELHLRHAEELSFLRLASHAKLIERVAALDIKVIYLYLSSFF